MLRGGANEYRFGKGLDTRGANGVFFVQELEAARTDGTILVVNLPRAGRSDVGEHRGRVDAGLVWPLLRGQDVSPWSANPGGSILAPHDPDDLERSLTSAELLARPGDTYAFLRTFRDRLLGRSSYMSFQPTEDCYWSLSGPLQHMLCDHVVVVREIQSRPAAAVISARYDANLRRTTRPLIEHKLLFCAVGSDDEAFYLAGAINSAPVQELLRSFANPIAISPQTLARLPIPPFDATEHATVVEAARSVAAATEEDERATAEEQLAAAFLAVVTAPEADAAG